MNREMKRIFSGCPDTWLACGYNMSCQSLSVVGGAKEARDVSETAATASCGTYHRSVRFSSESHSRRDSINDIFRRDSPGSTSMSVLAPAPAIPTVAFDRAAQSRSSIQSYGAMSQSAPSAFSDAIGDVSPPRQASNGGCRFPRLDECAHFHYERVCLGGISVEIVKDDYLDISLASHSISSDGELPSTDSGKTEGWVTLRVKSHTLSGREHDNGTEHSQQPVHSASSSLESNADNFEWIVTRSAENFKMIDTMLHRCIYDRKVSGLTDLTATLCLSTIEDRSDYECLISDYLHHLSIIADDSINCGPVLNWFQMDNKGHRLLVANEDTNSINTPAVAAAYSVRRYVSQARDELSFEVGDMISIIDMPGPSESIWWRGKRGFRVGFFPHHCVAVIGDKVPRHMTQPPPIVGSVAVSPIKPVLRKHGKLISLFRSFILARPSRRSLKQQGILRERVFGCDLGEHLLNSGRSVPLVLSACAALIEQHGVVDGIYRLSGATSLTQRLRRSFDDDSMAVEPPELLSSPAILHDVHAVASLIKMYFRELPNPLCTYQLYDHFVSAVQGRIAPPAGLDLDACESIPNEPKPDDALKVKLMKDVVMKLPPPHYRTMSHLMRHLRRMSLMGAATGMTARNMAIVWAPNLLREPRPHRALQGVAVQAVVTEFLICYAEELFSEDQQPSGSPIQPPCLRQDCNQTQSGIEIRSGDNTVGRRPKSLPLATPTKLLSLEEAQNRGGCVQNIPPVNSVMPLMEAELRPTVNKEPKYIEVGGGPSNLPQYHTVIELPQQGTSKRGLKRSPSGWRGLFFRAKYQRPPQQAAPQTQHHRPQISSPFDLNNPGLETTQSLRVLDCSPKSGALYPLSSRVTAASVGSGLASIETSAEPLAILRPVKSCESLQSESDVLGPLVPPGSSVHAASKQHSRSASCDSYFEQWQVELAGMRLRLSPQERDGNLFSEEDDTITISRKPQSSDNAATLPQTPSSDTSPELSPKRSSRLPIQVEPVSHGGESDICAADRKRTRLEDQLLDILFIDCNTPEHVKNTDPKMEQDPVDSRTKGSPEKRHSDTYEESPNSSQVGTECDSNMDAKRLCKNGQVSTAVNSPSAVENNTPLVKLRERSSPRKQKPSSIRYSGLHSPLNLNAESRSVKPQGKIVKIVNQLDQNTSRSSWHGLSQGNSHSTLIKIDWTGDNPLGTSNPTTPVTPVYDLLESESEFSDKVSDKLSVENHDNFKDENESINQNSIDSYERSNTASPTNISYQTLNRLSALSATSSNSTEKDQKLEHLSHMPENHQVDVTNIESGPVSISTVENLVIDNPKDFIKDSGERTQLNSACSPSSKEDIYECFNFTRPSYINLHSSSSSKSSSLSPSNPSNSPIRSTISITYKSPTRKERQYENVDILTNIEQESIYENVLPAAKIVEPKLNDDLIILESPENCTASTVKHQNDDPADLYSQVRCFRRSVHEVNALLEAPNIETIAPISMNNDHPYENYEFTDNTSNNYENVRVGRIVSPILDGCFDRRVLDQDVKFASLNILELPKLEEQDTLIDKLLNIEEKMQIDEVCETLIVEPSLHQTETSRSKPSMTPPTSTMDKRTLSLSKELLTDNGNSSDKAKVNVRKLANRFESPTETKSILSFQKSTESIKTLSLERSKKDPSFERSKALSLCDGRIRDVNRKVPCIRARSNRLTKNSINTRSLDENAFEKEFGSNSVDRRKSLEATMRPAVPKSLDLNLNLVSDIDKENDRFNLKLNFNIKRSSHKSDGHMSPETYETRFTSITPTTENKISLVQARFSPKRESKLKYGTLQFRDDKSFEPISLDSGLTSLIEESDKSKLSRERIEKYKEERRNFLREKYSSQSFRGMNEVIQTLPVMVKLKKREDTPIDNDNEILLRHPEKLDRLLMKDLFEKSNNDAPKFERRNTVDASHRAKYNSFTVANPPSMKISLKSPTEPRIADEAPNFTEIARKFSIDGSKPRKIDGFDSRMAVSWDISSSKRQQSLPFIRTELSTNVKKDAPCTKLPLRVSVGDRSPVADDKPSIFSSTEKQHEKRSPSFNIKDVTAMFEQKSVMKN